MSAREAVASAAEGHAAQRPTDAGGARPPGNPGDPAAPKPSSGNDAATRAAAFLPADQQLTVISRRDPEQEPAYLPGFNAIRLGKSLEGQTLGHFELLEFVGGGGMGAVFRARDTALGRTVAVKVLSRDQGGDEETVRRFRNEAQSAARLDHENIARVYYVGQDCGWNYIVFEFIEGTNLRDLVAQRGPLSLEEAISYTLQVAEALNHAFKRDVVHRDIKPSNVLITPQGKAKLVDMGLARLHQVESSEGDLTASGVTLGTFDYISPEQARDPRSADVRSDLYSLGCTLFFTLTGQPPFPDGTVLQKLLSHTSDDPPDVRQFRPDLPEEVSLIVGKLLAKHPDQRYQEPSELVGELLLLADGLGLKVVERGAVWITPGEARLPAWERHLPWAVPLLLLASVVLATWILAGDGMTSPPWPQPVVPDATAGGMVTSPAAAPESEPIPANPVTETQRADAAAASGANGGAVAAAPSGATPPPTEPPPPTRPSTAARTEEPAPRSSTGQNAAGQLSELSPRIGIGGGDGVAVYVAAAESRGGLGVGGWTEGLDRPVDSIGERSMGSGRGSDATNGGPATWIVGEGGAESLAAVLAKTANLPSPQVIELRFNGIRTESPLDFRGKSVTVRAAPGSQPTLLFEDIVEDGDEYETSRAAIRMIHGELAMEGVHLQYASVGGGTGGSLFELAGGERLRLSRCVVTMRDAAARTSVSDEPEASTIFRVKSEPLAINGNGAATSDTGAARSSGRIAIDLSDCILRGDATVLRFDRPVPLRFIWRNGMLATSDSLLVAGGASASPDGGGHIRLELYHLTASMQQGLCRLATTPDAPHSLTVAIKAEDSIFLTPPDIPLISQRGPASLAQLRERLVVSGRGNFYPQSEVLWRLESTTSPKELQAYDFAAWRDYWPDERLPESVVLWDRLPDAGTPAHVQHPGLYALSQDSGNFAFGSADDGADAGFVASRLPAIPGDSVAAPEAPPDSSSGISNREPAIP